MGTLDQPQSSTVARKIALIDWTAYTTAQLESVYNTDYGAKGWHIIQIIIVGTSRYILAEKEL